jgi:hypothetical protein
MPHTIDATAQFPTTATALSTANPVSTTFTCGAGTTVLCVLIVYVGSTNRAGGAPTYNGVAMLQADTVRRAPSNPEGSVEAWYMLSPPTGSAYTLNVPNTGALGTHLYIGSAKAQSGYTSELDAATGTGNTSANPSVNVTTTVVGDIIFSGIASGATTWAPSAVTSVTMGHGDYGAWGGGASYHIKSDAGLQQITYTFATSDDWGLVVAAFKEVPPGGGSILYPRLERSSMRGAFRGIFR